MIQFQANRRTSSKAVAVHEAGHLFVNLHLQPSPWIGGMWIRKDRAGWHGCVEYVHRYQIMQGGSPDDARRELLVTLAGPIAEIRWREGTTIAPCLHAEANARVCLRGKHEYGSDYGVSQRLVCLLAAFKNQEPEAVFLEAWSEADDLVDRYWRSILAVGSILKARRVIAPAELYALPEVADLSPRQHSDDREAWVEAQRQRHGDLGALPLELRP